MTPSEVLLGAFLIGVVSGLRSQTAPARVAWAGHKNWLSLQKTPFSFMGSTAAVIIFVRLALVELVTDQLRLTPSRLKPPGLIARIVLGGLPSAAVALAGGQSLGFGAVARTGLVRALKVPDIVIALLEDAAVSAAAFFWCPGSKRRVVGAAQPERRGVLIVLQTQEGLPWL